MNPQARPLLNRIAHRLAMAAALVWFGYGFFSTRGFAGISGQGLLVYLLGLPLCYAAAYYLTKGLAWVLRMVFDLP